MIASSGIVVVPVLSGVLFRSPPVADIGYVVPHGTADDRRDRIVEIGDELREFFEYGIEPTSGGFRLSEQDVADILEELVLGLGEDVILRSVAVDLAPDAVNAFLVVDAGAAAREAGVSISAADRFLSFGVTTVDLKTNVRFVGGSLKIAIQHIQVGHAPEFLGRLLAFISEIPIDSSISRLPVDTAIEELVVGEGLVELKFKGLRE